MCDARGPRRKTEMRDALIVLSARGRQIRTIRGVERTDTGDDQPSKSCAMLANSTEIIAPVAIQAKGRRW